MLLTAGESTSSALPGDKPAEAKKKDPDLLDAPAFWQHGWIDRTFKSVNPRVELKAPARLKDYVVNGKLELSLKNYIDLVMANNTDVEIQRATVEITRNAITRAFAVFDPTINSTFNAQRSVRPTTTQLEGADTLKELSQPFTTNYLQTLQSGTQITSGWTSSKLSTNNSFANFNPSYNSQYAIGFTQPLMRNRGVYLTKLPITIARGNLKADRQRLEDQVMRLLATAENSYWDVIGARESLRVQEKALELNSEALKRSRRELELGAISPLDIYQPEANYASAEIQVTQARYRLQQTEDLLRRQMGVDLDPDVRNLPITLTETVLPPNDDSKLDREDYVAKALARRPDLKFLQTTLDVDDLQIRQAENNLRPVFNLIGNYITTGRGGPYLNPSRTAYLPGGFGDSLSQVFNFGFPIYSMGLQLRLPLRDRAGAANLADQLVQKKIDALQQRNTQQTARQEVLVAISQVEASRLSIKQAIVARDLAQKQLDAEQKKYDLGTTVIFFVLDAQTRLVNAEAQLVNQSIQYRRNMTNLLRVTGDLLNERNVVVQ